MTAAAIISQNSVSFGCDNLLFPESYGEGLSWSNLDDRVNNFSMKASIGMIVVNILLFGILAVYLDQVLPNEYGKKRHPLLCLHRYIK
jgi:ATP-binding cassette subfamily A (ABC1) protein 3